MAAAKEKALVAVAEGRSNSEKKTPFKGVYVSFGAAEWVFVFAWDSYGEAANETIYDDALFTLSSITIKQ